MNYRAAVVMLLCLFASAARAGESVTLVKPIYAEVYLRAAQTQKISGMLLRYDEDSFVIKSSGGERSINWLDLTGSSLFTLRARLIDKKKAENWLNLGEEVWSLGATEQAQRAFDFALKLDPSVKARVADIKSKPAGNAIKPATPTTKATSTTSASSTSDGVVKYLKSTPEQDAAAIETAKRFAADIADDMKLKFTELQTNHFILFTDWDPQEYEFLRLNLEEAYAAVSKQFGIPVKENIFVGKLPVFMFAKQKDFESFAQKYDGLNAGETLNGYYAGRSDGTGHMAMWKPDLVRNNGNVKQAEEKWAYVLTHEFTHAFVNRYRSNARIARWLNEGLAEVIAQSCFPRPEAKQRARAMAGANNQLIDPIFDDDNMPSGQYYPVMQTMVEMLINKDTPRFIRMFNAIKDGDKTEDALKKFYGVDYTGLENAWRDYMMHPPKGS
jgi:hypothetical protein